MDHHRRPLGRLLLTRPLSFAERAQVEALSELWRVGDGCASLVLVAGTSEVEAAADLRRIARSFCRPRDLTLRGAVVLESWQGLHVVSADGRRVRVRRLGPPAEADPGSSTPPAGGAGTTAECRVIHLDRHRQRLRTAPREQPPDGPGGPGDAPEGGGWTS